MDVNNNININVTGNADEQLNKIGGSLDNLQANQTRVTQSTSSLSRETNNLNKGLVQNGGAMGLLSAATGGLAMDFKDALEATEGLGISLKGLRGAIIATGIGALAILVLELVTNWEKWSGVIDGSTKKLEANKRALGELNAEKERFTAQTTYELELAKIQGATEEELHNQRVRQIKEKITLLELEKVQAEENYRLLLARDRDSEETENARLERNRISLAILELERQAILSYNNLLASKDTQKALDEKNSKLKTTKDITEATKKAQDDLNKSISEAEKGIGTLKSINELLRGITTIDLTSEYAKWKQLTDAYWNTKNAINAVQKALSDAKKLNASDGRIKTLENELKLYNDNYALIDKLIRINREYLISKEESKYDTSKEVIALDILTMKYDQLSNALYNYERADFTVNRTDVSAEKLSRINELLNSKLEIIRRTSELEASNIDVNFEQLQKEMKLIEERNALLLLSDDGDIISKINQRNLMISAGADDPGDPMKEATEQQQRMVKEYFDNMDKLNDYRRQSQEYQRQLIKIGADEEISLNQATLDAKLQQELIYLDLKLEAQENYYNAVRTLESEVYSFLDQLQNAQIIKDKNIRNILLVAQKGAEIANVVIGTVRENNRLKTQATQYKINGALNLGLAASLAVVDPISAASYGAAGANYLSAAAGSMAAIPVNWGIAGASIASILATTLTSWNKSSGGGGGAGGGSGVGPQAQFNIVGSSGTNQLAAGIASQQNMPVNAYVVGSDVSTAQALDRNRIQNATFL